MGVYFKIFEAHYFLINYRCSNPIMSTSKHKWWLLNKLDRSRKEEQCDSKTTLSKPNDLRFGNKKGKFYEQQN